MEGKTYNPINSNFISLHTFQIEAQGDRICYISSKLYHLSSTVSGESKTATRGVPKYRTNVDDVSFAAFRASLDRPIRFAKKIAEMRVRVTGVGRLAFMAQADQQEDDNDDDDIPRAQATLKQWLASGAFDEEVRLSC